MSNITQVQRIGSKAKYEIHAAIDNAVKMLEIYWGECRVPAYKMNRGQVTITMANVEYDGWADVSVYEVSKDVYIAIPTMYYEEENFSLIGSDGNEYIWYGVDEIVTPA